MPIARTPMIDDDGSGEVGTVINNDWKVELYNQIDAFVKGGEPPGIVNAVNGGSNVFDLVLPTPRSFHYVRPAPISAPITLRSCTPGRMGDLLLIENIVPNYPTFITHNAAATAPFYNRVNSGPTPLAEQGSALYVYDDYGARWTLAQHDQGKAINVPYNAANFSVTWVSGTWTVEASDIAGHAYYLRGNEVTVWFSALNTTIGGGTVAQVTVAGWPFTSVMAVTAPCVLEHGVGEPGVCTATAKMLQIYRHALAAMSGANLSVNLQISYPVT